MTACPPPSCRLHLIAACIAVLGLAHAARAVNPLLLGTYDGADDRTLATTRFGDVKEKDLLLFLTMRDDPMPDVLERYLSEPELRRREELRDHLHIAIEDLVMVLAAPKIELQEKYPRSIDRQAEEMFLYPVYDWIWADYAARHEIDLTAADLRKFYNEHSDLFIRPGSVTVRLIFKKAPRDLSSEAAQRTQAALDELRARAVRGEDFAALARENSDGASAVNGGLLPPVSQGVLFREFDEIVDELQEGAVSEPFAGPGGLYLVKLEARAPQTFPQFAEIKDEVRRTMQPHVLRYWMTFHLEKLMFTRHNFSRLQAWNSPDDADWLARVGDFRLTNGDFLRLFPEVMRPDCFTDETVLAREAGRVFVGEIMKQECLNRGLLDDARLARARELAPAMLRVRRALIEKNRPFRAPSTEALQEFHRTRPELFEPLARYGFARIAATLRNPEKVPALERLEAIKQAKEQMAKLLAEQVIVLKEISRAAGPEGLGDEASSATLRQVAASYAETFAQIDSKTFETRIERIRGYYDARNPPEGFPEDAFQSLEPFAVIGPLNLDNEAVFWVCEYAEKPGLPPFTSIRPEVEREYARVNADAARRDLLASVLPLADPTWTYDQLPYRPQPRGSKRLIPHLVRVKEKKD